MQGADSPPTAHRRRAMEDAIAVLLVRCAELGQTFWGWSTEEWIHLLGRDQGRVLPGTHPVGPATGSAPISPRTPICSVPSPSSTSSAASNDSLCRIRIFGRDRVSREIDRVRKVLAKWGYRLGHGDDTLLLNRSPHVEDLGTEVFGRIRHDELLGGARLNTVHAAARAVNALGFCDPPPARTGRGTARAIGGAQVWQQWVERCYATSILTPRARRNVRSSLLKVGRRIAAEHPDAADPAAWTRQTCAAWVAAVDRMNVGDYVHRTTGLEECG